MTERAGFIALTGRPNVGKSTLLNYLVESTVAITSPKPQTTRQVIRGVTTRGKTQFVFFDTPGMHRPKDLLGGTMMKGLNAAISDADVVCLMIEASFKPLIADQEKLLISKIKQEEKRAVLAINKVDLAPKEKVLPLIDLYLKEGCFSAFVPLSAQTGEGTDALLSEIEALLPEQPFIFSEDDYTDQTERHLTAEIIRRELVFQLRDELPYGMAVAVSTFNESMDEGRRRVLIEADIVCDRDNHKGMVVGKKGTRIKQVGQAARRHLETLLEADVTLLLQVRVKEKWRDSAAKLDELGF